MAAVTTSINFLGRRDDGSLLVPALLADEIIIGDALWRDEGNDNVVRPAASLPDQGSEQLNQELFRARFAGIAATGKPADEAIKVRVIWDPKQEFQVPAVSATYSIGDRLALNEDTAGTALLNQQYVAPTNLSSGILIVVQEELAAVVSVRVRLLGTVFGPMLDILNMLSLPAETFLLTGALVLTKENGRLLDIDPQASLNVDLPAEADMAGQIIVIKNTGEAAEIITVRDDAAATIATIAGTEMFIGFCNGTNWFGVGALVELT
jgi:hypothetical protein